MFVPVLFYMIIGMALSIPYCLIAGWDSRIWATAIWAAPIFTFCWIIFGLFSGHITRGDRRWFLALRWRSPLDERVEGANGIFWAWTGICLLPIAMHWTAILFGTLGYKAIASTLETHRYASIFYVLSVAMIVVVTSGAISNLIRISKEAGSRVQKKVQS